MGKGERSSLPRRFVNGSIRRPKTAERASSTKDTGKLISIAAQQEGPSGAKAKCLAWTMTSGLPSNKKEAQRHTEAMYCQRRQLSPVDVDGRQQKP